MIRLITATPGSGKTCLVVEWLLKEVDRQFYKEFYTNIEDLRIVGFKPLPPEADWRTLNPNKDKDEPPKLMVVDEAQYFDAFMKETKQNAIGKDLSTHRHYGIDLWIITQSPKLLNSYVLENVGEHVHLYRPQKKKTVNVYWWSYAQSSLTKSAFKSADDMQKWRLNPAVFDYYKSTSQVTDSKARVSQKVVSTIITGIIILVGIGFFVNNGLKSFQAMQHKKGSDGVLNIDTKQLPNSESAASSVGAVVTAQSANVASTVSTTQNLSSAPTQPTQPQITPEQAEFARVASVIQFGDKCTLYNSKGMVLDLPKSECMAYASGDKRMSFSAINQTSNDFFMPPTTTTAATAAEGEERGGGVGGTNVHLF